MTMTKNQLIELVKTAQESAIPEDLAKAFTQSGSATTGLTGYDLRSPAYNLYPVLTPLRNSMPRVVGGFGTQANWKAITGINTGNTSAGVGEGNRGGNINTTVTEYLAAYRTLGLEDSVTYEAQNAGRNFQDVKATAGMQLLRAMMLAEERAILGGNGSNGVALGTPTTPTIANSTNGGSLAAATYNVMCVALTFEAFFTFTVANGLSPTITRTNTDGSTDTFNGGLSQRSATAAATTTGATSSLGVSVSPVRGAYAYAWYWGTAGSELLGAITTINSFLITTTATGTQNVAAVPTGTDRSRNALMFDGLLSMAANSTMGGYYRALATGTPGTGNGLTAGTDGTISEIDDALQFFWDTYKISPTKMFISSQEMKFLRRKILTGTAAAAQRFIIQTDGTGELRGGTQLKSYLNPFTMDGPAEIPFKIHPNMPAGTILFVTDEIPYPMNGIGNTMQMMLRQDYYQIDWPQRSRKFEMGVYMDGVLQHFAPFSLGVITNIAAA